jgi:hypothetical protein
MKLDAMKYSAPLRIRAEFSYKAKGKAIQFSRQSAHEGGKVVSPMHRPPLTPGIIPDAHFC